MARTKNNKKVELAFDIVDGLKEVNVIGKALVKKVLFENEKVQKLNIELYTVSQKNKVVRAWITATNFNEEKLDEGDKISFSGYIASSEYNGKWSNDIILKSFTCENDI